MKLLINVIPFDIEFGQTCSGTGCPVALSLSNIFDEAIVSYEGIFLTKDNKKIKVDTPQEVASFMNDFDSGVEVQPFSFELELEDSVFNLSKNMELV